MTTLTDQSTASVDIDAEHLPGVVYHLVEMLGCAANGLDVACRDINYDPAQAEIAEIAMDAADVVRLVRLLDQLRWRTDQRATVVGTPDWLRDTFEEMRDDARRHLAGISREPAAWADPLGAYGHFERALAGAEHVLAQLGARDERGEVA